MYKLEKHQSCFTTALHLLELVIQYYPGSARLYIQQSKLQLELHDYKGAETALAHGLELDSQNPMVNSFK